MQRDSVLSVLVAIGLCVGASLPGCHGGGENHGSVPQPSMVVNTQDALLGDLDCRRAVPMSQCEIVEPQPLGRVGRNRKIRIVDNANQRTVREPDTDPLLFPRIDPRGRIGKRFLLVNRTRIEPAAGHINCTILSNDRHQRRAIPGRVLPNRAGHQRIVIARYHIDGSVGLAEDIDYSLNIDPANAVIFEDIACEQNDVGSLLTTDFNDPPRGIEPPLPDPIGRLADMYRSDSDMPIAGLKNTHYKTT